MGPHQCRSARSQHATPPPQEKPTTTSTRRRSISRRALRIERRMEPRTCVGSKAHQGSARMAPSRLHQRQRMSATAPRCGQPRPAGLPHTSSTTAAGSASMQASSRAQRCTSGSAPPPVTRTSTNQMQHASSTASQVQHQRMPAGGMCRGGSRKSTSWSRIAHRRASSGPGDQPPRTSTSMRSETHAGAHRESVATMQLRSRLRQQGASMF
eukprot:scaffold34804_cov58-Phaeocystis_antarctica.AAC.1